MNKRDLFRLTSHTTHRNGVYNYDFGNRRWFRVFSLSSMARLTADFPIGRSYFTGHVKPSLDARA